MLRRAFVSVDLEGMPYVVSRAHIASGKPLWNEAREIATSVVNAVAEALRGEGVEEVVIADSHGEMVNVMPSKLPSYAYIIRGYPRPVSMVALSEGCDAALFVGYHAKSGTERGVFDHTYSGAVIRELRINGEAVSEYLLNALTLGDKGIPVILVAGDEALREEVSRNTPWAEFVPLKRGLSRYAAISPSLDRVKQMLRDAVKSAVARFARGEAKPLKPPKPIRVDIVFHSSAYADTAELMPGAKRVDPTTVSYTADDMTSAYRAFELLVLAAIGTKYVAER
ncbi:peptide transporter [Candidatus Geothermarchaeota archaeon ex4572_27]|nr:MAG: peptide transporter [Candidatus Geothermarchaeota archaeon ex4572_27]